MRAPAHTRPEYYAALDGFRGILALLVAIYHTIWLSHPNQWTFFNNAPVIVDMFFALSGFLMWRLYSDKLDDRAQVANFMKRRFARLYPLHLFMLVIFIGFAVLRLAAHKIGLAETTSGEVLPFQSGAAENWSSLLQNLTMTHAFGLQDSLSFNPPSWSIGAEFWTYLLFALVILWCRPRRLWHFLMIALCVALLYLVLSRFSPDMNISYDLGFWRCVAGFFTGVLAAVTFVWLKPRLERVSALGFTVLECAVLASGIAFVIYCGGKLQFFVGPILFLFMLVFAFDGGAVSRVLSRPVFRYLAKISYSIYMTHVLVAIVFAIGLELGLGVLPTGWAGDFWLGLYLLVVIGVSHLTWSYIEKPGGRWLRGLNWPQKKQVAKATPSV